MHLLYLDESGHADDPRTKFFVLAGFSVFERTAHWLDSRLTPIAQRFDATQPENIELHGSPMRSGRGYWHKVPRQDRERAMADLIRNEAQPALLQSHKAETYDPPVTDSP